MAASAAEVPLQPSADMHGPRMVLEAPACAASSAAQHCPAFAAAAVAESAPERSQQSAAATGAEAAASAALAAV